MRACYGSLGESEEACVESSVTIPRDASCVPLHSNLCNSLFPNERQCAQAQVAVFQSTAHWFPNTWLFYSALLWLPSCVERASERDAGWTCCRARREKTLGTHLFMELFAFSRESPHAMGRSSEVKVDFDKSHIHKRSGTPPKFSDIPTNSAKKCWICHEAQRYRQWCAFFARLCSMSARRRMWTFLVFCPLLTSKSSQATFGLSALSLRDN